MAGIGNELTTKFVKAHFINQTVQATVALRWMHKLIYEFWGFCVNGGNSLTAPGGFASGSLGVLMPAGFESGSTVLIVSGSDGQTTLGNPFFTAPSVNWTSGSMVGKWLVCWQSSSVSTDDSIYPITQVINSSTIRVDTNAGGTPYNAPGQPSNLHPSFTARTNINYRVIDFNAAANLPGYTTDNDGLVLNIPAAYLVNSGQVQPQIKTRIITTQAGLLVPQMGMTLSPSGSWQLTGSNSGSFSDPTAEFQTVGRWGFSTGTGFVTLIGAQDFMLAHSRGSYSVSGTPFQNNGQASGFHFEIPQRLYPQNNDPNPVVMLNFAGIGLQSTPVANGGGGTIPNYTSGFLAHNPPDNTSRYWTARIRSLTGTGFNGTQFPSNEPGAVVNGRFNDMFFNVYRNKFMMHELALSQPGVQGQFSTMRMKLRRARFVSPITPSFQRFGDFGEWFHTQNGILWPWDNSVLPYNLFQGGF